MCSRSAEAGLVSHRRLEFAENPAAQYSIRMRGYVAVGDAWVGFEGGAVRSAVAVDDV